MLKTLRLRIEQDSEHELVITLTAQAAAEGGWGSALATARIPADLSHLAAPQLDGKPATPEAIRRFLLTGPGADPLTEIGTYLGGILLPDSIRAGLTEHATADARIVLDVEPAELRMVPWEMALNPDDPGPLFLDQRVPWARLVEAPAAPGPADCWPLLRVLVVVGVNAGHQEEDDIAAKLEVERIRDELDRYAGFVDYDILDRPSSEDLGQRLAERGPDIFHFIGHGTAGNGTGGALRVRPKESQAAWWWTPGQIATKLQHHVPRLVVLNACRTADVSAQRGTWNVIDAFVRRGVPAIIAMQGDIRGDAAAAFSGELYRALGDGMALDVAVARARDRVSDTVGFGSHQVWLPSLTFTSTAEAAFPRRYAVDQDDLDRILATKGKFEKIRAFVDRTEERRDIWQTVCTLDAPPRVIALQGDSLAGKSAFAKWLIGSMALRGRNAAYVELAQNVGTLALLGRIAEELAGFPKQRANNEAVFDEWLREVDRLQRRDPPGPSAPVGEGRYSRRLEPNGPETLAGDLVGIFADALDRAADGEPLVLAIDPVARIETGAWDEYIVPNLIERIADRRAHIQLVLVVRTGSLAQLLRQRQQVLAVVKDVTIGPLPSDQKEVLMRQYMLGRGYDPEKFQQWVERLAREQSWTSELFAAFESLASSLGWRPS